MTDEDSPAGDWPEYLKRAMPDRYAGLPSPGQRRVNVWTAGLDEAIAEARSQLGLAEDAVVIDPQLQAEAAGYFDPPYLDRPREYFRLRLLGFGDTEEEQLDLVRRVRTVPDRWATGPAQEPGSPAGERAATCWRSRSRAFLGGP